MKIKKENQARYEIFRQKPLTSTLLLDVQERLGALKGLLLFASKMQSSKCSVSL